MKTYQHFARFRAHLFDNERNLGLQIFYPSLFINQVLLGTITPRRYKVSDQI